jgi:hypothetical protein
MDRYDPRLSEYAARQWLKEANGRLPLPATTWQVDGFPGYTVDVEGCLFREAYTDAAGHRRRRKEVRTIVVKGSSQFRLFRNGFPVWVSRRKMRALLRKA